MYKKIVIGLVEHMGDIVACEPICRYFKSKYEFCEITWVTQPKYNELIVSNPYIDKVVNVKCLTEWIILSKHYEPDVIICDLHINYRECECCRIPLIKSTGNVHISIYNWYDFGSLQKSFFLGAGIDIPEVTPQLYIQKINIDHVDKLNLPKDYVVIHRYSNDINRDWSDDKWAILIAEILRISKYYVVEVGTPKEGFLKITGDRYIDLLGATSMLDMAEVIARSKLFIGIDSGPAHYANALKVPSVILIGTLGNYKTHMPYSGYMASDVKCVRIVRNLSGPSRDINIDDVFDAISHVLTVPISRDYDTTIDDYSAIKLLPDKKQGLKTETRVLAFYLPQFYPLQENDAAWGDDFVEWTTIIHSKPVFEGHKQPFEPGELGYYDLRCADVIKGQCDLAKEYGVNGFCFYYYCKPGKRYSYKPLERFLENDIDFPFCLILTKHNWTKCWDIGNSEIIYEQFNDNFTDEYFIKNVVRYFNDPRYIKIDGKPLLIVSMPQVLNNIKHITESWRSKIKNYGYKDLYLLMIDDWDGNSYNPSDYGFDGTYEMPTNSFSGMTDITNKHNIIIPDFTGKIVDYEELADAYISRPNTIHKRFKTVMAPWDNTPRYNDRATVTIAKNNDAYKHWLTNAIIQTDRIFEGDERIIFIHSWNQWAEGTNIEPDRLNGRERLQATKAAIDNAKRICRVNSDGQISAAGIDLINQLLDEVKHSKEYIYRYNKIIVTMLKPSVELNMVRQELSLLRQELSLLNEKHHHVNHQLKHLLESSSIKITTPLRKIKKFAKKIKRWYIKKFG
jgi:ADP-heptose:LPS heptosyltransferase